MKFIFCIKCMKSTIFRVPFELFVQMLRVVNAANAHYLLCAMKNSTEIKYTEKFAFNFNLYKRSHHNEEHEKEVKVKLLLYGLFCYYFQQKNDKKFFIFYCNIENWHQQKQRILIITPIRLLMFFHLHSFTAPFVILSDPNFRMKFLLYPNDNYLNWFINIFLYHSNSAYLQEINPNMALFDLAQKNENVEKMRQSLNNELNVSEILRKYVNRNILCKQNY